MTSLSLMLISNLYSVMFTFISLIRQNQFDDSLEFMFEYKEFMYHISLLSLTSCIGQIFIFVTIEKFGALVFTLIMTTRQVLSIVLSSVFFEHSMTMNNKLGTFLIFFALFLQQFYKIKDKNGKPKKPTGDVINKIGVV
jgi:adenosine 3'-phospho 5'-phosphosulfate transporter B2